MNNKKITINSKLIKLLNLLFIVIFYYMLYYFINGDFQIPPSYGKALIIFIAGWFIIEKITQKYNFERSQTKSIFVYKIVFSNIYLISFITLILTLTGLSSISRSQILGTFVFSFCLDLLIIPIFQQQNGKKQNSNNTDINEKNYNIFLIFTDLVLFSSVFFLYNYLTNGLIILNQTSQKMLCVILVAWLVSALITDKYGRKYYQNIWHHIFPFLKSIFLMAMVTASILFVFRWKENNIFEFIKIYLGYGFLGSFLIASYNTISRKKEDIPAENNHCFNLLNQNELIIDNEIKLNGHDLSSSIRMNFKSLKGILNIIHEILQFKQLDSSNIFLHDTCNIEKIKEIKINSLLFYLNLNQLNDFDNINEYYKTIYKKLRKGGYIFSKVRTISNDKNYIYRKYPKYFSQFVYFLYFIFTRILPKLPIFKNIHHFFTNGKRYNLSKAEAFGRLYYCGFKIIAETTIDDFVYYIGQKTKTPSTNNAATNSFLIRLKRLGFNGEAFDMFKFRTMYPYSEYLQEYIYEQNNLHDGGKLNNDFRVTQWGKFMRKFWIDEIPQFINLFRGDIKLFGVRALSEQYFNLYPPDVQKLRLKFKNGLIPPYYADMPNGFDQIVESERKYLQKKLRKPFYTDFKYFTKAISNILIQGIRSR